MNASFKIPITYEFVLNLARVQVIFIGWHQMAVNIVTF